MNDSIGSNLNGTTTSEEFVWRRLEEPLRWFGTEMSPMLWLVVLGVVLGLALVYVVWMYRKDSLGVGPWWASLLGLLRLCVYAILSVVFLLPARQSYVETRSEGKVLTVFDVSSSMATSDVLPTNAPNEKLPTRQDRVLDFLREKNGDFLAALEKKNPVTAYRLGSRLDEAYLHFSGGRAWTKEEKENPVRDEQGNIIGPEIKPLPDEYWQAWLNPQRKLPEAGQLAENDLRMLEKLGDLNTRIVRDGLPRGTNLGDTLINLINKEMNNRLQGIVVFTDGRNTEGSPNAFRDLEARAKAARVPFFVVGVGEDRQKVKIEIVDLRAPQQIQPEDKFRVKTELTGEGLGGEKVEVAMEVSHVRIVKSKVKGPDGKLVEREVEESLPIELIEAEDQDNPRSAREKINLGEKLILKPAGEVGFDKATPPRLEVEWQLDAAALATAGKIDLESGGFKAKKWEIAETRDDSELRFQVRVPVDKREGLREKFHESNKMGLKVIKKPLRVLLVAAAANRDYQFLRSLLLRETEKKRMELAIYLQLPPGETKRRPGVVQDVPPERLLSTFPDSFRTKKGDLYDLSSYDVIVAFDADWMQIQPDQIRLLRDWAEKGGGLVVVGGYINTVELIRPRDGEDAERFKPVLDLLPVVLDDRRDYIDRKTDDPWPLDFEGASPEMEFLKLDEELDETKFKEDWQAFFFGLGKERTEKPQRGYFSFYPVQRAKTGSLVIGRFADPSARLKDNSLHPYLVASPEALPRVVWLGSAESWRLREYRENYHERFWTKLLRYAAAKSKGPIIKSIRIESPTVVTSGRYMEVEARIDGPDGQPLDRNAKPTISVKLPPGVPDSEIKQPIPMIPRPGARDGWFSGRFLVRSAGEYEFTVKAPRQLGQESEQAESAKFTVKEANPELDNTRPDFDRLYRLASEADEVMPRMATDGDRAELRRRLVRPRLQSPSTGEREDQTEIREDRIRLFFDLKNASLIPGCMVQDVQVQRSRGRYQDLWDDGFTLYEYPVDEESGKPTRPPIKLSYVLLLVVGLLSVEWLTRKLLRLA